MKKLPFYIRLGFAIMGKGFDYDPFATPAVDQNPPVESRIKDPIQPPSQIAWVSTKSRLPELYKEVTIFTTDKETLHGWARVNNTDYIHSKDDRTINNVTHWLDMGSPNTEIPTPEKKDTAPPQSQIASNKPRMPR
jgi:hypothetical protein